MKAEGFHKGRKTVGKTVNLRTPAKVNLHLEVLRQRHDGYHQIETVFQAVRLFDSVAVTLVEQYPGGEPLIELLTEGDFPVPADETNLCWRAIRHFCRQEMVSGRFQVRLTKKIPVAAGLGGGSSDAAATLLACNRLFAKDLPVGRLQDLGAALGADVPFFIRGGTALGRGIGTDLSAMPVLGSCQFVIIKPDIDLSAFEVYQKLKLGLTVNSPKANINVMKPLLARFPHETWPGFNRLEEVVLPAQPLLQRLVLELRGVAPVAMLAGSGAAVYAAFPQGHDLDTLVGEYERAGYFVRVTGPYANGAEIMDD